MCVHTNKDIKSRLPTTWHQATLLVLKAGRCLNILRMVIMFLSNYEVGNSLKVHLSDLVLLYGEPSCGLEMWLSN